MPLRDLTHEQQILVHRLICQGMTVEGYAKVLATMNLEHLLRELNAPRMGHVAREFRDPGAYYLTFFDQPQPDALWGWRLLGHHISLNFTVHDQERISATPMMIGAQPARVGVFRPLAEEEDLAFALLRSLSDEQRDRTVIHHLSPADFVTQTVPRIGDEERPARHGVARRDIIVHPEDAEALRYIKAHPRGVAFGELDEGQRAQVHRAAGVLRRARAPVDARPGDGPHRQPPAWTPCTSPGPAGPSTRRATTTACRDRSRSSSSTTPRTTPTTPTACGATRRTTSAATCSWSTSLGEHRDGGTHRHG